MISKLGGGDYAGVSQGPVYPPCNARECCLTRGKFMRESLFSLKTSNVTYSSNYWIILCINWCILVKIVCHLKRFALYSLKSLTRHLIGRFPPVLCFIDLFIALNSADWTIKV